MWNRIAIFNVSFTSYFHGTESFLIPVENALYNHSETTVVYIWAQSMVLSIRVVKYTPYFNFQLTLPLRISVSFLFFTILFHTKQGLKIVHKWLKNQSFYWQERKKTILIRAFCWYQHTVVDTYLHDLFCSVECQKSCFKLILLQQRITGQPCSWSNHNFTVSFVRFHKYKILLAMLFLYSL